MLLNHKQIQDHIEKGDIKIEPFEAKNIRPACYIARLGSLVRASPVLNTIDDEKKFLDSMEFIEKDYIQLLKGEFINVTTIERFELGAGVAAFLGPYANISNRGLNIHFGAQIHPTYKGYLTLGISNLSPFSITLKKGDPILMVSFMKLDRPATIKYVDTDLSGLTKAREAGAFKREYFNDIIEEYRAEKYKIEIGEQETINAISEVLGLISNNKIDEHSAIQKIRESIKRYYQLRHK